MKNNYKSIAILIITLLTLYIAVASYLVYDDYSFSLDNTIKTSDHYCEDKAKQVSDYIDNSVNTANTIAEMLSSARQKVGYNVLPIAIQGLQNVCEENTDINSITVSWELSAVDPSWNKPVGRVMMKAYMFDGRPVVDVDTIDVDGEYTSENYYQLKNGAVHTLFTSPEINNSDYISQESAKYTFSVATRILLEKEYIGSVSCELSISSIASLLEKMPLDYAGKTFVVASNGKIYCHHDDQNDTKLFLDAYSGIDCNDNIVTLLSEGVMGSAEYTNKRTKVDSHLTLIPIHVKENGRSWTLVSEIYYDRIWKQSIRKVVPFAFLSFLGLALMVFFTISFVRKSSNPMQRVTNVLRHIDAGEYDKIERLESADDEINNFYQAVNTLAGKILETTQFARSIGQGELNTEYQIENPNALDLALLDMQENLKRAKIEEENRKMENEKLSWSQNGLAQLGEYLRMNNANIHEFAYNVVSFLVKYVKALQGGLFISEEADGKKFLTLRAAYAFDRKKQLEGRVEFGESLVGRCAIEGKSIFLTDVPDGYLYITSGLGENKPRCILLVPLKFEDEVHGVIEIASLKMIEEYQIEFFNNVAERIASSISNIKKNINTAELLEKFRTQSDELAFRESEIQKSLKKIDDSKDSIEREHLENEAILNALSKTCIITQYDIMGVVLELRDNYLEETGYKMSDIVGHPLKEILALTKNDMDNFDKFWNDVIKGKSKSRKFTRGDILFKETFTLITDESGQPTKVISVAIPK